MKKLFIIIGVILITIKAEGSPFVFSSLDIYDTGGVNKSFENTNKNIVNLIHTTGITASGETKTQGGIGGRVGLLFPLLSGFEFGPSMSYIKGPTINQKIDNGPFSIGIVNFGSGETNIEVKTYFLRFLVEGGKNLKLSGKAYLHLGGGAGVAFGRATQNIESSGSASLVAHNPFLVTDTMNTTNRESWSGLTWELNPSFIFKFDDVDIEAGYRFAQFPTKSESDMIDKIDWKPRGIFISLRFSGLKEKKSEKEESRSIRKRSEGQ